MRIGVITFWHGDSNYGQIFQCWALQEFLRNNGHEPFVIRFIPQNYQTKTKRLVKRILPVSRLKELRLFVFNHSAWRSKRTGKLNDRKRRFADFRENNIKFSERIYQSIEELRKNPPEAECYITGSDQVWAQLISNPNNHAYFLDFGGDDKLRVAYAPSFVMKEYPKNLRHSLKKLLCKFDRISVREYSGIDICRSVGAEAIKVLDPTFLISISDFEEIASKGNEENQIFIYSINIESADEIRWRELKTLADTYGLKVKVTPANGYFEGSELFDDDVEYQYSTPEEWLGNLIHSKYVVTTSFHGVVLSIILHRPFIYIPLMGQFESGNSRVIDLLNDLKLTGRILSSERHYAEILDLPIDWEKTELLLGKQRKVSREFLINSIKLK